MSINPERSGVVISWISVFEVGRGVGGGWGRSDSGLVHSEDVEERRGAEVVHVDHPVITNREVLILTEHVTAFVLVLHDIFILQRGHWTTRLIIDGLFLLILIVVVLRDPPPGVDAVDQGAEPEPNVRGRHVRSLAGARAGEKH